VSCKLTSTAALASITPVTPPNVNKNKKPKANNNAGVNNKRRACHKDAIHENILTPVGTAITIVAAVKKVLLSVSIPTVYI